jgi:thiamine-phosphate pyrophosphorylase
VILQLVTDRRRLCAEGASRDEERRCLRRQAEYAVDAGIDMLQIRERDLDAAALEAIVVEIVSLARGTSTRVLVNDRLDIAIACGADGVHLRADSIPPAVARAVTPAGFVIGCSVHSLGEARAAAESVDYLLAGTVWPSVSKPLHHEWLSLAGLQSIARHVGVPVLAIGGVTIERLPAVLEAGAAGAAAIGLFVGASDRANGHRCRAIPLSPIVEAARSVV